MNKILTIIVLFALYATTLSDEKPNTKLEAYQLTENDIQDIRWLKDKLMKRIQKEEDDEKDRLEQKLRFKIRAIKFSTFFLAPLCVIFLIPLIFAAVFWVCGVVKELTHNYKMFRQLKMIKKEADQFSSISISDQPTIPKTVASNILSRNKKRPSSSPDKSTTSYESICLKIDKLENEIRNKKEYKFKFLSLSALIVFGWIFVTSALLLGLTGVASYIDVIVNQDKNCTVTKKLPVIIGPDCFDIYGEA